MYLAFMSLVYFDYSEFDSPDVPGSGKNMDPTVLEMLDSARAIAGVPFKITSGWRSPARNREVGGKTKSSHLKGLAVDIAVPDSMHRFKILQALMDAGFTRIGIGKTFIHADADPDKIEEVAWLY